MYHPQQATVKMLTYARDTVEYQRDALWATLLFLLCVVVINAVDPFFSSSSDKEHSVARTLIEEANQWYSISSQDQHAHSSNQHASFATAYLHASRHIASDVVLERLSGIDVHELQLAIETKQKQSGRELLRQCPKLTLAAKTRVPTAAVWK